MKILLPRLRGREGVVRALSEPVRVFAEVGRFFESSPRVVGAIRHGPDAAFAVLLAPHFDDAPIEVRRPMQENDYVRVLLDRAGFAQVA